MLTTVLGYIRIFIRAVLAIQTHMQISYQFIDTRLNICNVICALSKVKSSAGCQWAITLTCCGPTLCFIFYISQCYIFIFHIFWFFIFCNVFCLSAGCQWAITSTCWGPTSSASSQLEGWGGCDRWRVFFFYIGQGEECCKTLQSFQSSSYAGDQEPRATVALPEQVSWSSKVFDFSQTQKLCRIFNSWNKHCKNCKCRPM